MNLSFYDFCWLFFIYGFLGWCSEVGFAAIDEGRFVNRGFLNGPICPIYGVGVILIILFLTTYTRHILTLFFGSMILATALEYLTGWFLEKVFHAKWWDYTKYPFNYKGYICLEFSLLWGFAATFMVKLVHPAIVKLIHITPPVLGMFLLLLLFGLIIADLIATLASIRNLQRRLQLLTAFANEIHGVSDRMGSAISGTVMDTRRKVSETIVRYDGYVKLYIQHREEEKALSEQHRSEERDFAEQHRAEEQALLDSIRAESRERKTVRREQRQAAFAAFGEKPRALIRLLRAFPTLRIPQHQEILDFLRDIPGHDDQVATPPQAESPEDNPSDEIPST